MTAREEVERLLAKHQARFHYAGPRTRTTCAAPGCAWECRGDGGRQHLAHVAQVLDEAGLLAEPEAEVRADERRRVLAEVEGAIGRYVRTPPGVVPSDFVKGMQAATGVVRGMAKAAEARQKPSAEGE